MNKIFFFLWLFPTLALAENYDSVVTDICGEPPKVNVPMKDLHINTLDLAIKIPENFTKMPDVLADRKYPHLKNLPKLIYSTDDGAVSLGLLGASSSNLAGVDMAKDAMLDLIKTLKPKAFPLTVAGGKAWLVIFNSQDIDGKVKNIQLITILDTKFVVGTFSMADNYINQYCHAGVLSLMSLKEKPH